MQLNHQSLSSSTTSLSTSNLPSSSSLTPSSSDPKISEDLSADAEKQIDTVLKNLLQKVQKNDLTTYSSLEDAPQLDKINQAHRWALVRDLHNKAVDISGLTEEKLCFIGTICAYWFDNKQITKQDYVKGLSEYITTLDDIVYDVPKVYEWTAQMICKFCTYFTHISIETKLKKIVLLISFSKIFIGFLAVAFFHNIITLNDLRNMAEEPRARILGILLPFMAYEYGPQYVRDLWKRSECKWEQFVVSGNVDEFVEQNVSAVFL